MDAVSGIAGAVVAFLTPAAFIAGITALIVRSTRSNLGPAEANRVTKRAFWMAFVIVIALELLVFGLCVAALTQMG